MPVERPNCPICAARGSVDAGATWSIGLRDPFRVAACPTCGMRWLDPVPTEGEYESIYRNTYFSDEHARAESDAWLRVYEKPAEDTRRYSEAYRPLREAHNARMLARLDRGGSTGRLLEIGCGHGEFLLAARAAGWTVSGIEPSTAAARKAREEHGLDVVNCKLADNPHPGPFDAIYLSHVFEHLTDSDEALRQMLALLAPGGLLLIVVPNQFEAWAGRLTRFVRRKPYPTTLYSIHHPLFFGPKQIREVVRRNGLDCEIHSHQPYEFGAAVPARVLRRIDWLADRVAHQGRNLEVLAWRS
jgi:SAM-dependent methyltransferase